VERGRGFVVTGIDRSDYMVEDLHRAVEFYRTVLGLEPLSFDEAKGAEFELPDGAIFGLWMGGGSVAFQPGNGIMFAVSDFPAAVAGVRARGLPILQEFETEHCSIATFHDSEGNTVNLHKRK
jgi:predicted enzyme related to lactoylglutathione lyase